MTFHDRLQFTPFFTAARTDLAWMVRKACALALPAVATVAAIAERPTSATSPNSAVEAVTDAFQSLSRDGSRWVRLAAFYELGKLIAAFLPRDAATHVASPSWSPRHPSSSGSSATASRWLPSPVSPLSAALQALSARRAGATALDGGRTGTSMATNRRSGDRLSPSSLSTPRLRHTLNRRGHGRAWSASAASDDEDEVRDLELLRDAVAPHRRLASIAEGDGAPPSERASAAPTIVIDAWSTHDLAGRPADAHARRGDQPLSEHDPAGLGLGEDDPEDADGDVSAGNDDDSGDEMAVEDAVDAAGGADTSGALSDAGVPWRVTPVPLVLLEAFVRMPAEDNDLAEPCAFQLPGTPASGVRCPWRCGHG